MSISWHEKDELIPSVLNELTDADVLLDIGCGIRPQRYIKPFVHICCEPFQQYVEHLRQEVKSRYDCNYVILKASWAEAVELLPQRSVDSVFLIDVIEHVEKEVALKLLRATEVVARRQIVIFTPLGFMPQHHRDGKDAWGFDGGAWQEHRSGWVPEEFDNSWEIHASKAFHTVDNMGKKLEAAYGAFWALKTFDNLSSEDRKETEKRRLLHTLLSTVGGFNRHELGFSVMIGRLYRGLKRRIRRSI